MKNSRENSDGMRGGMLILSYPSIEAYEISNFIDSSFDLQKQMGKDAKEYINENARIISMNKISGESIIHAVKELLYYLSEKEILINLDDFSETNTAVFEAEEQHLKAENAYRLLSLLSCMLMDLGILRE